MIETQPSYLRNRRSSFKSTKLIQPCFKIKTYWKKLKTFALVIGKFQVLSRNIILYGSNSPVQIDLEDSKSQQTQFTFVLSPKSKLKHFWDSIIILVLLYTTIFLPYQLAFNTFIDSTWQYIDDIFDILYLSDVIVNLNTAVFIQNKLSYSHKEIFIKYLKSWLIIDIISGLPLTLIAQLTGQTNQSSFNKFLRFFKINRIYRITRFFKIINSLKIFHKPSDLFNTASMAFYYMLTLFFSVHILACMWYYVSDINSMKYNSWDTKFEFTNDEPSQIYLVCVYYVFTTITTVGYGDIVPKNNTEKLFAVFLMMFGAGFYSFTVSSMLNIIKDKAKSEQILKDKLKVLKELSVYLSLDNDLYKRTKSALKIQANDTNPFQFDKELLSLPCNLKIRVFEHLFTPIINEIAFLRAKPKSFSFFIIPYLNMLIYTLHNIIYDINEVADEIYIIRKGYVKFTIGEMLVRNALAGDYFGECEVFEDCLRQTAAKVYSKTAEIYSLNKIHFFMALDEFVEIKDEFFEISRERVRMSQEIRTIVKSFSETEEEVSEESLKMIRVDTGVALSLLKNNSAKKKNRTLWARVNREVKGTENFEVTKRKEQTLKVKVLDESMLDVKRGSRRYTEGMFAEKKLNLSTE